MSQEVRETEQKEGQKQDSEREKRDGDYIEISNFHCENIPSAVVQLEEKIALALSPSVSSASPSPSLEDVLKQHVQPGISQQMDLRYFVRIFQMLEPIFHLSVQALPHSSTYHLENTLLITTLKYLCHILKNSTHKRYFLSIELLAKLLSSNNLILVELVTEVLFYFTMPSFSLTSLSEEQVKDTASIQLSAKTVEQVSVIFDSLGYLSPSYGLLDFLRGHGPLLNPSDEIVMKYPVNNTSEGQNTHEEIQISIPSYEPPAEISTISRALSPSPSSSIEKHIASVFSSLSCSLTPLQFLSLRYVIITTSSLNESLPTRLSLVALRLRLLYILIYNQSTTTITTAVKLIDNYLMVSPDSSSKFFKDLMILSDISSSIWSELDLSLFPYPLASLALDCLLGVVETNQNIRRVPSRTTQSITLCLQELGVYPSSDRNNNNNPQPNLSTEFHWLSILISACGIASQDHGVVFPTKLLNGGIEEKGQEVGDVPKSHPDVRREEVMGLMASFPNSEGRIPKAYVAEYIHMGIELFSTCLTIREYRMHSEAVGLGTLVSFLSNSLELLRSLIENLEKCSTKEEWPELVYDLFPIWKTLQCLDSAITSHPSRNTVLRENDILNVLSLLIEIFSTSSSSLLWKPNSLLNDIMLSSFSLLDSIISCGRRRMLAPTESGVQILYQAHFTTLCNSIIKNQSQIDHLFNLSLLQTICELISSAVELEPQFLAHFLRSGIAEPLLSLIISPRPYISSHETIESSPLSPHPISCSYSQRAEGVLLDFLQLIRAMCLTADGRILVLKGNIIKEILTAVAHPHNLTPCSEGISVESLELIGNELVRLLQEHERPFRGVILDTLRAQFLAAAADVKLHRLSNLVDADKLIDLALQKLVNTCVIIQTAFTPGRDGVSSEISKEFFLRDGVLACILEVYEFTLPRSRQLFAEITTHYGNTERKYYGNYYVSQSLANLVKIGIVVCPMELLPNIFTTLDSCLRKIGEARDALLNVTKSLESKETELKSPKDSQITNVSFLGVMDSVPDECIFTSKYAECCSRFEKEKYENCLRDLIQSIVVADWVISMAVVCFHPTRQNRGQAIDAKLILTGKEVLRRLFTFYRSSLLEVCRIFSQQWGSQEFQKMTTSNGDSEYSIFPSDFGSFVGKAQFPRRYLLRISIASGAIVRERSEIDGSRVFLTIPRESELVAYERVEIQGGVIRYRTAHGWISEFQRDSKKHPIVTLLDILDSPEPSIERDYVPLPNTSSQPINARKAMESCTLRDGLCHLLSRSQNAMQILAGYLSQTIVTDIDPRSTRMTPGFGGLKFTEFGHVIAISMAKIVGKFFENPRPTDNLCWPRDVLPRTSSEEQLLLDEDPSRKPNWKKVHESKSFEHHDDGTQDGNPSIDLNIATVALYLGAIINFTSSALMDDRRKNPNTYNLKRLLKHGVIHALINSYNFVVLSLESEIRRAVHSPEPLVASSSVRCLLQSITPYQQAIYKLVQYDALNRAPLTALMRRSPESNDTDITVVLQKLVLKVGRSISSLFESNSFHSFPPSIQSCWFSTLEELLESLKVIRDINQRGGNENGLNESLVGRIARMRNLLRPESRSDIQQQSEELTSPTPQEELLSRSSHREEHLMEAATDLGFAPLQVIDAINATNSQDMVIVLDYLLHSNNSNTSETRTISEDTGIFLQNSSDTNRDQLNESLVTIDSARSTLSHSQPETISSEQLSATQASVVSALSGFNSQPTASTDGTDFGRPDHAESDSSDSDSSDEPSGFPEHAGDGPSHDDPSQSDMEADDEEEMLRLALAMSLNSDEAPTGNQEPEQVPEVSPISSRPMFSRIEPSRPSRSRTEDSAKSGTSSLLVENSRQLLTDYGKLLSSFLPYFLKNLSIVNIWGDRSIDIVSTRLFTFVKKLSSFSASLNTTDIFEFLLEEIFSISTTTDDLRALEGLLSLLHLIMSNQKALPCVKDRNAKIIRHFTPLLELDSFPCAYLVLLIFHDILAIHPLKGTLMEDPVESKDDVSTSPMQSESFESLSMLISDALQPQIPRLLIKPQLATVQALLLVLTSILVSENTSYPFVMSGYLKNILDLELICDTHSIQPLVSLVIRRCLETSALLTLTMKYEIKSILKKLEHSRGQHKSQAACHIPLDEFLQKSSHLHRRNPSIFTSLIGNMFTCYRLSSNPELYVKITETADSEQLNGIGVQAVTTLNLLIDHTLSATKQDRENLFISPSISLHALADSALIMKAIVVPITKRGRDANSFLQFLLEIVTGLGTKSDGSQFIHAATRLLIVLSSHRGPGRRSVLDTLLQMFKEHSFLRSSEEEEIRLRVLSRLGRLLPLICSACKFTRESIVPPQGQKSQHISIDTLSYLFHANISSLLIDVIASIDVRSSAAAGVITSLLESLEIFMRPPLLTLFLHPNGDQSPAQEILQPSFIVPDSVEHETTPIGVGEDNYDHDENEGDVDVDDEEPEEEEENEDEDEEDIEDEDEEDEEDEDENEEDQGFTQPEVGTRTSTRAQNRIIELLEMFQGQSPDVLNFPGLGNENIFQTPPDQLRSLPFDFLRPDSLNDSDFTRNAFLQLIRNIAPEDVPDPASSELPRESLLPGGVERALHLNWGSSITPIRGPRSPELRRTRSERSGIFGQPDPFFSEEPRAPRNIPPQFDETSAIGRELETLFRDQTEVDETQGWTVGIQSEGSSTLLNRLISELSAEASIIQHPEGITLEPNLSDHVEQIVSSLSEVPVVESELSCDPMEHSLSNATELCTAEGETIPQLLEQTLSSDNTEVSSENLAPPHVETEELFNEMTQDMLPVETSQIEVEIEQGDLDEVAPTEEQPPIETGLICPPGYDVEVFNSLPDFMQREIIESHIESTGDQMNDLLIAAGYDLETINSLPENIRQEIIDQVRRDNPQFQESAAQPEEIDNNSFLMSLTEELRTEVLLTAEPDFLASLSPEFQAQANVMRERHARQWAQMEATTGLRAQQERRPQTAREREIPPVEETPKPIHPGYMRIRKDEIESLCIPNHFWKTVFRLLYVDKLPISTSLLHRIFHHLTKDRNDRIFLVKIIMTLLGDVSRNHPIFEQFKDDQALDPIFPPGDVIHTSRAAVLCVPDSVLSETESDMQRLLLPSLVGRRLVSLLSYLCHQESVLYEIISPRPLPDIELFIPSFWDGGNREGVSEGSYLELILSLLRRPQLTESSHDLLQIARLIDQICEPFEILKEVDSEGHTDTNQEIDTEPGVKWVKVPSMPLSRDSLRSLCDALMSEYCTKDVFDRIISSISRLAEVKENCSLLVEVLVEVLGDLAGVSDSRIQFISAHLVASNEQDSKSFPKSQVLLSIPLGEIGSQDHLRLLRVIQTLQSLCLKMGKKIHEVTPVDELQTLWRSTDNILRLLQRYTLEDGNKELHGEKKKQQNSSLSSVLSKLLPLIESFFILHSTDYLQISSPSDETKNKSETDTSEKKENGLDSLPGAKYRTTEAFKSMNLSLFPSENELELQQTPSLTRMKSFPTSRSLRSNPSFDSVGYYSHSLSSRLFSFVHSHQAILNLLILSQPSLLEGSFQSLIRFIQLRPFLSFHSKRLYFTSALKKKKSSSGAQHHRTIHLQIHRENVFEESFSQLRYLTGEELKGRLSVHFHEEEGVDAGGLTREFYSVLCREIFNPNYCLFTAAADGATFQPNPLSSIHNNHLDYFKFVGKIFGKALLDGYLMDGHFTRSFYKHILGLPVEYSDIEGLEPEYYKSLSKILEYSLEDLGLELTFSAETQTFGKHQVVDLIPNGRNIPVTEENKIDYIRLISHHSMTSSIRSQIINYLDGFYSLVPVELISLFSPTELELLISGLPEIDVEDLRAHTDYSQYRVTDRVIEWFWNVLRGFTREEKALFIQFVTGTSKVPLEGFAHLQGMRGPQRFAIHRAYTDTANLPTAHTCFNQLDLPEYKSEEELREKLKMAIKEGSEGFGFA